MKDNSRRGFMGKAFGAVAGVGAVASLYAMKKSWDPLPSVKAAGTTTVDTSTAEANVLYTEKWRGKPIFILKKSKDMKANDRDVIVGDARYHVSIGLCTHLGCIPAFRADLNDFKCACHGGEFTASGAVQLVPPPRGFDIPPFKIDGTSLILGEAGPEYEKMKLAGVLGTTPLKTKV